MDKTEELSLKEKFFKDRGPDYIQNRKYRLHNRIAGHLDYNVSQKRITMNPDQFGELPKRVQKAVNELVENYRYVIQTEIGEPLSKNRKRILKSRIRVHGSIRAKL